MIPGRTVGEDGIAQNQFNDVGRSESLALNGESIEAEDIHRTLEPDKTSSMTRRGFLASALAFLAGCGSNNDDQTGTEREGVETPPTETAYPVGDSTEPKDAPTQEDTSDDDDAFDFENKNMTPYEQVLYGVWSRGGVNEYVADEIQRKLDEGIREDDAEKIGEAAEEVMRQGVQEGHATPANYHDERDYLESGPAHSLAKLVELYGEEDPDNIKEALGIHRTNVDIKRVLLDGQEADVAILEYPKAEETVLATNIDARQAPGTDADAYRVGTEPEGYTQEMLKALTEPEDPRGFSPYDLDSMLGVTEGDIDTQTNAENHSKVWPDLEAGANTIHEKILNTSTVPQRVMITMDYLRDISEQGYLGMDRIREHTEVVQQASPAEDETIVVGLGQDGLETQTVNYDYSRGFVENLSQL